MRKIKVLLASVTKGENFLQPMEIEDDLKTFYKLIDCDTIDIVTRSFGGKFFDIICDDEGCFKENPCFSASNRAGTDGIVGNIIITGAADREGNLTSLTDEDVKRISSVTTFALFKDKTIPVLIFD